MGYDYSLGFLAKHHDLVQTLIRIAQSGEVLTYEGEQWEKIRQRHQLIRSVLANMSRNMDGWEDIRTRVRTWTEHTEKGFRLLVGAPAHTVTGRPPAPASVEWRHKYVPVQDTLTGGVFQWPNMVDTDAELAEFYGEIPKVNEAYHTIEMRTNQPLDHDTVKFLDDSFQSAYWTVKSYEEGIVRLRRFTPSEKDTYIGLLKAKQTKERL
jgi:hypothetical protein